MSVNSFINGSYVKLVDTRRDFFYSLNNASETLSVLLEANSKSNH